MIAAPRMALRVAMPGRPTALVAGANSTCSVMNGMASASTSTMGAAGSHFSPSITCSAGSATLASPRQNGTASSMITRTDFRNPSDTAAGSSCTLA